MTAIVHNFADSLRASHDQETAPYWLETYRRAFPTLASCVSVRQDGWAQRAGIDRILTLSCGRRVTIDEKVRAKDYGDILLERWSDYERRVAGWIVKPLACDYIAYAIVPIHTCFLFPTLELQRAWRDCGQEWAAKAKAGDAGFQIRKANNGRYTTVNLAVPTATLFAAIQDAMSIQWSEAA